MCLCSVSSLELKQGYKVVKQSPNKHLFFCDLLHLFGKTDYFTNKRDCKTAFNLFLVKRAPSHQAQGGTGAGDRAETQAVQTCL